MCFHPRRDILRVAQLTASWTCYHRRRSSAQSQFASHSTKNQNQSARTLQTFAVYSTASPVAPSPAQFLLPPTPTILALGLAADDVSFSTHTVAKPLPRFVVFCSVAMPRSDSQAIPDVVLLSAAVLSLASIKTDYVVPLPSV
ncbi:hypothetical protein M0R45_006469 [Rubus argutus]|uniref:Uncharacterized protein n=1 Tax=Rubus argutus TaxID=59490 RepID=A0AAW1YR68_RUBAR